MKVCIIRVILFLMFVVLLKKLKVSHHKERAGVQILTSFFSWIGESMYCLVSKFHIMFQHISNFISNRLIVYLEMNSNLVGVKSIDVLVDRLKLYVDKIQTLSSVFILLCS